MDILPEGQLRTECFPFLVLQTTYLPVDRFLIFGSAEDMCSMDVVPRIPWSIVMIFDVVRLDLYVPIEEHGVVIVVCTPVTVFHCLS